MFLKTTLLIVVAAGVGGSRFGHRAAPAQSDLCRGDVKLVISDGATPDISWEPNCRMMMLGVETDSTGSDLWWVVASDTSSKGGFVSPVRYGTVPAGAVEKEELKPIKPLTGLQIVGYRWTGADRPAVAGIVKRAKQ